MKRTLYVLAVLMVLTAVPVFAQGAFNDVPPDHWAYDAVNMLQKDGYIIGYPDGTFQGKRSITRYEFAVAIARIITNLPKPTIPPETNLSDYVKRGELSDFVKRSELPDFTKFANRADLDAIRKLVDEFRDELTAMGCDVDALKRDVAALDARVAALEAEARRLKISGVVDVFGIATNQTEGLLPAYDRDERPIPVTATLGRTVGVVKDFDLNIVGRLGIGTTANATINYGNYLNYLAFVDDYAGGFFGPVGGQRPTSKKSVIISPTGGTPGVTPGTTTSSFISGTGQNTLSDVFFPYYLYIDIGLGKGEMLVGRFPLQFTPYTLKKIDVDTYTNILKTDSGNYPVDGVKLAYNFGIVDLTLYAAKHNENDYLINGLTAQPRSGIYDINQPVPGAKPFHVLGGNSVGGLPGLIAQSAGVRAVIGIPWSGSLGLTYYQAWSQELYNAFFPYDQAQVFSADLNLPISKQFLLGGSWTRTPTRARSGSGAVNIDSRNVAWDARIGFGVCRLGLNIGYKSIGPNFAAAGAWDKIGRWTNPTNVQGPYGNLLYPISANMSLLLTGEVLTVIDPISVTGNTHLTNSDTVTHAQVGFQWGLSKLNSLDLGYEWVDFDPNGPGDTANENYLTIGWAHQMGNAGMKIGYQFINYTGGSTPTFAYGPETYRAGLGVVQFGVSF